MAAVPAEARRKSRVILWDLVGILPIALEKMAVDFVGYRPSFWLDTILVLVVFLYPLSFAYAVVKHRVMEIPVLLRRSARYVLVQRGFIVLMFMVAACAITLFTHVFSRLLRADTNIGMALSAVFGIVLVWTSAPLVKRGTCVSTGLSFAALMTLVSFCTTSRRKPVRWTTVANWLCSLSAM